MFMDVKYFYLDNYMEREENIILHLSMFTQEFVENTTSRTNTTMDISSYGLPREFMDSHKQDKYHMMPYLNTCNLMDNFPQTIPRPRYYGQTSVVQ